MLVNDRQSSETEMGCASSSVRWSTNVDVPGLAPGSIGGLVRIAGNAGHGENAAFFSPGQVG